MQFNIYLYLGHYILFCTQYCLTEALVGDNVKSVTDKKYTFVACITKRTGRIFVPDQDLVCTGAVVSKRHVMTGAHCVNDDSIGSIQAMIGSLNIFETKPFLPEKITTYDEWARSQRKTIEFVANDIAIIKLSQKVPSGVTPVSISYKPDKKLYGKNVATLGWGLIKNSTVPLILQKVNLVILEKSVCEKKVSELSGEALYCEPRMLCTFTEPYSLFQYGDSGGPLIYHGDLIAINKGTAPNPETEFDPRKVNVHLNLDYYKSFIKDALKL